MPYQAIGHRMRQARAHGIGSHPSADAVITSPMKPPDRPTFGGRHDGWRLKGARRPLSYGAPSDREPCEGRQASPSIPTKAARQSPKSDLNAVVVFRCTPSEKQALTARSARTGLPLPHRCGKRLASPKRATAVRFERTYGNGHTIWAPASSRE